MRVLLSNLVAAARSMAHRPAFTIVTVLTLALGIGVNTAIFSVVNAVLIKPLPYPDAGRLVAFRSNMSAPDVLDVRAATRTMQAAGGMTIYPLDYTGGAEPQQVECGALDAGLFDALGVPAALGRTIAPDEDQFGSPRTVVLSDRFWRRTLGARPDVLGQTIPLSGNAYTVVGVMPPTFAAPERSPDLYASVRVVDPNAAEHRGVHFLRTYARLAPGVTIEQAQSECDALAAMLTEKDPVESKNIRLRLEPLRERLVGDTRPALLVLFGAVGLVLLIACANFANLLLARAAERGHETAIRAALGASRGRLVGETISESVLYAILGGIVGLVIASWSLDVMLSLKPEDLRRLPDVSLDATVLAFTFGISLLTGLVFGLIPAFGAARADAADALRDAGRGVVGAVRHRVRSALVVSEVAFAVVLLVGAGLLINSFWHLRSVEPGFDPAGLVTMRIDLPPARYKEIPVQARFREQLVERLGAIPGARAALVSEVPLGGDSLTHNFAIEGREFVPGDEPELFSRSVAGDYFGTMGIPILEGRALAATDAADAPLVGVVNESFAREYFPNGGVVGSRIRWSRFEEVHWMTIVGVAGDVRHFGLDMPEQPAVYTPYAQSLQEWKRWQTVVLRAPGTEADLAAAIKREVWAIDPQLSVTKVRTMDEVMGESFAERRFTMALLAIFAAVAIALAAMGIYGVMAFSVAQRTHEIGVRMALGARTVDLLRLVVGHGLALTLGGAAIGIAGAVALSRLMSSLLFGVTATDPATLVAAVVALVAVGVAACYVPARHAARVDPMRALRNE